jgi:hypothetical protein
MSKLAWNFYRDHQMSVALHYSGERFDDTANNFSLNDFLLFHAELRIFATKNIRIFITGQNLLDTRYQRWKGFPEQGISGHAGIQLVF